VVLTAPRGTTADASYRPVTFAFTAVRVVEPSGLHLGPARPAPGGLRWTRGTVRVLRKKKKNKTKKKKKKKKKKKILVVDNGRPLLQHSDVVFSFDPCRPGVLAGGRGRTGGVHGFTPPEVVVEVIRWDVAETDV